MKWKIDKNSLYLKAKFHSQFTENEFAAVLLCLYGKLNYNFEVHRKVFHLLK